MSKADWQLLFDEFVPGSPVPYTLVTQASLWRPRSQNYAAYKSYVGSTLASRHPDLVLPEAPPTSEKKARAQYNKEHGKTVYAIAVTAYLEKDSGDWSNYLKAAEDALQDKRAKTNLIWNDSKIVKCFGGEKIIRKEDPGLQITLWRKLL